MCNMPGGGHGHGVGHGHGHGWSVMGSGCCTPTPHHGAGHHGMGHHGYCTGGSWRRFMSPAEELERLHNYLAELKKEMAGVEAKVHDLKGKQ
jgi:hypothetical protein